MLDEESTLRSDNVKKYWDKRKEKRGQENRGNLPIR